MTPRNAYGYQQKTEREKPNIQQSNMSMEEMFKKIMADQGHFVAYLRHTQLATKIMEKQFG